MEDFQRKGAISIGDRASGRASGRAGFSAERGYARRRSAGRGARFAESGPKAIAPARRGGRAIARKCEKAMENKPEATDSIMVAQSPIYFSRFQPKNRMSSPKTI